MLWKRGIFPAIVLVLLVSFVYAASYFDANSLLLKVSMKKGDVASRTIGIASDEGGDFSLEISGIEGASLSEENFYLNPGESREVRIEFDSSGIEEGVYAGNLRFKNPSEEKKVPLVLEVESVKVLFGVNLDIPPDYSEISPGERVVAQVRVFDLTSGSSESATVDIDYFIFDIDGNVIVSETDSLVVSKQAQASKSISFPKETKEGGYIFASVVKYGDSVGTASYLFSVKKSGFNLGNIFSSDSDWKFFAVLGTIVFFFCVIIFLFVYLVKDRDKLIKDLRDYHVKELDRQREILGEEAKILRKKGVSVKVVKKEVKKKVRELKQVQNKRVKEIKKMKKKGNIVDMKRKIKEWEGRGYDTEVLKYKLDGLSQADMNSLVKKWKKEGYHSGKRIKNKK